MVRVIAEVGSTHMGKMSHCIESIQRAKDAGAWAVKFQLFPNEEKFTKSGNVYLSFEYFKECVEFSEKIGIACSASVFSPELLKRLLEIKPPFIKFAYSQNELIDSLKGLSIASEIIVSTDHLGLSEKIRTFTKLLCIPQYPVYSQLCFDECFPPFDGFSDHTLGINQSIEAARNGATIIEKHVTLRGAQCPDAKFAISYDELKNLVRAVEKL